MDLFKADQVVAERMHALEEDVAKGRTTPSTAAIELLYLFKSD